MIFKESNYVDLTKIPRCIIYFLLDDEEVVYVGQTKTSMYRIHTHYNNKKFNRVYAIPCKESELDYLEDLYIKKYTPKYNKMLNTKYNFSLDKAKLLLNEKFARINNTNNGTRYFNKCSKFKLRKMIKELNIQLIEFNKIQYLNKNDFNLICEHINLYNKGVIENEIFNIGI